MNSFRAVVLPCRPTVMKKVEASSLAREAQEIELADVFYPVQLNLAGRVASRNSKDWPASKLSGIIGKTDEGSWIARTVKTLSY